MKSSISIICQYDGIISPKNRRIAEILIVISFILNMIRNKLQTASIGSVGERGAAARHADGRLLVVVAERRRRERRRHRRPAPVRRSLVVRGHLATSRLPKSRRANNERSQRFRRRSLSRRSGKSNRFFIMRLKQHSLKFLVIFDYFRLIER